MSDGLATLVPINEKRVLRRVMFRDSEGNIWVGTDGNGLIQLKKRKLLSYSTVNGLPSDFVRAVTGDGKSVWVSSDLGITHIEGGQIKNYSHKDGMQNSASQNLRSMLTFERYDDTYVLTGVRALGQTNKPEFAKVDRDHQRVAKVMGTVNLAGN